MSWWEMKQGLRAKLDTVSQLSSTEPSPLGPGHGVPESFNPYCTGASALSYCRGGTEAGGFRVMIYHSPEAWDTVSLQSIFVK